MRRNGDGESLMKKDCKWLKGDKCAYPDAKLQLFPFWLCAALLSIPASCGPNAKWYEKKEKENGKTIMV